MNTNLKTTLIAMGVISVIGVMGAQAFAAHELAQQVAAQSQPPGPAFQYLPGYGQIPQDPWVRMHDEMMRMQAQMDRMLNASFQDPQNPNTASSGWRDTGAQVSLEQQGNDYVVKAQIPGAKENDINVKLDGRLLSISSQTEGTQKRTGDNGQLIQQEQYSSSFQQAFTLPGPVDASAMHTHFQDGVLTVTIPKLTS